MDFSIFWLLPNWLINTYVSFSINWFFDRSIFQLNDISINQLFNQTIFWLTDFSNNRIFDFLINFWLIDYFWQLNRLPINHIIFPELVEWIKKSIFLVAHTTRMFIQKFYHISVKITFLIEIALLEKCTHTHKTTRN